MMHSVKSVHIWNFGVLFSHVFNEYENLLCKSPYSVQIRENMQQKSSKYGHFLLSDALNLFKETLNCTNENKMKEKVTTVKRMIQTEWKRKTNSTINCFRNI